MSQRIWREYSVHICLSRLPSSCVLMLVTKRHSYYQRCKTNNCWPYVDAHFQDGVGSVSLSLFTLKAAHTLFMTVCYLSPPILPKIHNQQTLTPRWRLFWGCGWAPVSDHSDHHGCQYIENKLWCTTVDILRLLVAYLNATIYVKPEMQNRSLERTGLAKSGETHCLTGLSPALACQESAGRIVRRVFNWADPFLWSKPRPLAG